MCTRRSDESVAPNKEAQPDRADGGSNMYHFFLLCLHYVKLANQRKTSNPAQTE